jgi:hypothetical protein
MKLLRCAFLAVLFAIFSIPLAGCGLVRSVVGLEEYTAEDGTVKVRSTDDLADKAANLLGLLGPWGIAAGAGLSLAKRIIRHREILAHGQKDDDFDGIPDDEQRPQVTVSPVPPTATSSSATPQ